MAIANVETKRLTADDLLRLYSKGVRGELIRGVLCETMPTGYEHGKTVGESGHAVGGLRQVSKAGEPDGLGLRRLAGARSRTPCREPDVAYFSSEKMPPGVRVEGYAEVVPDLVVEIVSPNDSLSEVNDKALMWLSYGVRLVWVVNPSTRSVDVHREGSAASTPHRERRPRRRRCAARIHLVWSARCSRAS